MFKNVWKPDPVWHCLIEIKLNNREPSSEEDAGPKKQTSGQQGHPERSSRISDKIQGWGKRKEGKEREDRREANLEICL